MAIIVNLACLQAWVPMSVHVGGRSLPVVARVWGLSSSLETGRVADGPSFCLSSDVVDLVFGGGSCFFFVGRRCRSSRTEGTADRPPSCNWPGGACRPPNLGPQVIPLRRFVSDSRLWLPPVRCGAACCDLLPCASKDGHFVKMINLQLPAPTRDSWPNNDPQRSKKTDARLDVLPGSS
jgi:hypothetical protein